jgi:hypothetical protein
VSNEQKFTLIYMAVAGVLIVGGVGWMLYKGLRDSNIKSMPYWRRIKLLSALLGVVGLLLFILGFESLVQSAFRQGSKDWMEDNFYAAKLLLAHERAVACAKSDALSKDACANLNNINNGLNLDVMRQGRETSLVTDWQLGTSLSKDFQTAMNRLLQASNDGVRLGTTRPMLPTDVRINVAIIATLLLIISVAGSVGEAAYQYTMSKKTR